MNSLISSVYGPVTSWRFGQSLGIDPILQTSTCSFNCLYCQLGSIQQITDKESVYVRTEQFKQDFLDFLNKNISFDVITFSGSGEPLLAKNLSEMASFVKEQQPPKPLILLTNSTSLTNSSQREKLHFFDRVCFKLDSATEEIFLKMNRPVETVVFSEVIKALTEVKSYYKGIIEIQTMFMPLNSDQEHIEALSKLIQEIGPSVVQLNTPKRPYPSTWNPRTRGDHFPKEPLPYATTTLKTISEERAIEIESYLRKTTKAEILSVYKNFSKSS